MIISKQLWQNAGPYYRAFHGFGQAKFPDGGSVLDSSQFLIASFAISKTWRKFSSSAGPYSVVIRSRSKCVVNNPQTADTASIDWSNFIIRLSNEKN